MSTSPVCGLVGLTRAAELLTSLGDPVDRSTLSRYVKSHADALMPERQGRETVVDFEALKDHRAENIRLVEAKRQRRPERHKSNEAADKIRVERQIRELDLAERQGAVVPLAEVQEAATSAVSAMRGALAQAVNETSEAIAAISGAEARLIRPHLRALERKAMDTFTKILADTRITAAAPA